MPATMASVVITMGRARLRPASMMASVRVHAFRHAFDAEVDEHDGVLGHDADQHDDADVDRHGDGVVGCEQADDDAAERQRQRQQNGDRLRHAREQQHEHAEHEHETGADSGDEALHDFGLYFRVADARAA